MICLRRGSATALNASVVVAARAMSTASYTYMGMRQEAHRLNERMASQEEIVGRLQALGVERGDLLVVHTSFSRVKPVDGGPRGLITALRDAIGDEGTLVMPSMADDDDNPFDPNTSTCRWLGVVADTFRWQPGVLRSDNPHAFAAVGPKAREILRDHPIDVPHGIDSPIGRVYEMDGRILLLGVTHESNTAIHLAENIAGVRYRLPKHVTMKVNGEAQRVEYGEPDHCTQLFDLVGDWLDERNLQRKGRVGNADALLTRCRDAVDAAVVRLRDNETVFLHPTGVDEECDEARASLP